MSITKLNNLESHIQLDDVGQSFDTQGSSFSLFTGLSLSIQQGQSYAITGPSGAGKSSLLLLASGLSEPTEGKVYYQQQNETKSLVELRQDIGFIFQQFHLLPELTALNNVALPMKLRGDKKAIEKAKYWLDRVGLSHRLNHSPSQLSGGEQQRVAIARALVFEPKFIFADEPTGNLDPKSSEEVSKILFKCCDERQAGLVIVTHSDELASRAQHSFRLTAGELQLRSFDTHAQSYAQGGTTC